MNFSDQLEPLPEFLFERREPESPCAEKRGGSYLRAAPTHAYTLTRSEQHELPGDQGFELVASPHALAIIEGGGGDNPGIDFCAEARADSEATAREALDSIHLRRQDGVWRIEGRFRRDVMSMTHLTARVPRHQSVRLRGEYAAFFVSNLAAPVSIDTTHARARVLHVAGDASVRVVTSSIDYAGDRGNVLLDASGELAEINLKITARTFEGTLEAAADGPVRVLVPPNLETGFEAVVRDELRDEEWFVCRADVGSGVRREQRGGEIIFRYGAEPRLRFVSRSGAVVVDNVGAG